ncbi:hypothetical protein AAZX31_12G079600 [Glycine max]|nr:hypothetical protein GLYMA_12G083650v4 [Glycine max]
MDFTNSNKTLLFLKASSFPKSHQNFMTTIETLSLWNEKSFSTVLVSNGEFSSSTSSFSLKISAIKHLFGAFNFDLCIYCCSLTVHARQPSMCAFTTVNVVALESQRTEQTNFTFSSSFFV